MIKGVNRQVVEITQTQCEYFERVLFFVKPEFAALSEGTLKERAGLIADSASLPPASRIRRNRIISGCKLAAAGLLGAAVSAVIAAMISLL